MKLLVASSIITVLLCGPALAQPTPTTPLLSIDVSVHSPGSPPRHFKIRIASECGTMLIKDERARREDDIRLCPHADRLEVQWGLREGDREHQTRASAPRAPGTTAILENTGTRLVLSLH